MRHIHSIVKPQMIGRSAGYPWIWRNSIWYSLIFPYRMRFNFSDGNTCVVIPSSRYAADGTGSPVILNATNDRVLPAYSWGWVGVESQTFPAAFSLQCHIFFPTFDGAPPPTYPSVPPPWPFDANFYCLAYNGATEVWSVNRIAPGSPAVPGKVNFIKRPVGGVTGAIVLNSIEVVTWMRIGT